MGQSTLTERRFEVDATEDNQIEHRLEFFTLDEKVWFAIRCQELCWETVALPKQRLRPRPARFRDNTITD